MKITFFGTERRNRIQIRKKREKLKDFLVLAYRILRYKGFFFYGGDLEREKHNVCIDVYVENIS